MKSAGAPPRRKWNGNCPDKLVKAVRDDQAAPRLEGMTEGGLFGDGFGPGVID
jgi:hypothetical protein